MFDPGVWTECSRKPGQEDERLGDREEGLKNFQQASKAELA